MAKSSKWSVLSADDQEKFNESTTFAGASTSPISLPEGFRFFKFPDDRKFITLDILPFQTDMGGGNTRWISEVLYYMHGNIGPRYSRVICPRKLNGGRCPICEVQARLDWNDPDDQATYNSIKLKERKMYYVRWLDGSEEERSNAYVLDQAQYSFGRLIKERLESRDFNDPNEADWDKYADPFEGYSLKLGLTKSVFNGKPFIQVVSVDFKPRQTPYTEEQITALPDLRKSLNIMEYDELRELYESGRNVKIEGAAPKMQTNPSRNQSSVPVSALDPTKGYSNIVSDVSVFNVPPAQEVAKGSWTDIDPSSPF